MTTTAAGYAGKLYVKATSAAAEASDLLEGVKSVDAPDTRAALDTTAMGAGNAYRKVLPGLHDVLALTAECTFEGDGPVQQLCREAFEDGTKVWVTYHADPSAAVGQKGWKSAAYVTTETRNAELEGLVTQSLVFTLDGVKTAE